MSKHDGASKEYRISSRISNIQSWIFWINISICLVAYVFPMFISKFIFIAQIVLPILYCLLAFINNNYFWYSAEKKRRLLLFSDGCDKSFCNETTVEYYNNHYEGSFLRLAVNAFESSFFTTRIAKHMLIPSAIKGVIVLLLLFVISLLHCDYAFILIVAQAIFSGTLLVNFGNQCFYYMRVKNIYESFFTHFITQGITNKKQKDIIFVNVVEYECIKSFYQIRLSTKIFNKVNPSLKIEWKNMESKIKIAPSIENNIKKI